MDIFQFLYDWFTVDVYNFVMETLEYLAMRLILMKIHMMIWSYTFFWGVAEQLLLDLNVASHFSSALNALPVNVRQNLEFFNVFTGLTWIMQAFVTKFAMKFFIR